MRPELTVIIPNFNKGDAVIQCVDSVLNQSFENWEIIFIDDGSTDGSFEKAKKAADGDYRCLFIKNSSGIKGANAARNLGIEMAKAEYIIFLDSDDLMTENCIAERLNDFAKNPDLDFIVYPMGVFNDHIGDSEFITNIPTDLPDLHRFLSRDLVWLISGPIWKKATLVSLGCFDVSLHSQQDYDLHVRALISGFSYKYFHKKPDIFYRQNTESIPRQNSQSLEHFRQRFQMILKHADLLTTAGKLGEKEKVLLSRYILDIGQMMRWHIKTQGKNALREAMQMWKKAYDLGLTDKKIYGLGLSYLRFKHNMLYNRLGFLKRYLERSFQTNLGEYIFTPNLNLGRVKLSDYAGN